MAVNRFFQRKRFAEFQPLSMQEMAFPFEKQEARTRENMAMAAKLSSLGLDINNLPVDNPYVEQNILPNWQKQKDELVKSYLAPNANARELAAKTYELYNTKQQIEGTTGKYLGQRLNTYNQKLKELEEDKTLNPNEKNALKAQLYNAFTEYQGGANPLEGVELPRWTASYNPTEVEKRVQSALNTLVDRDVKVGEAIAGFEPNEYTDVYQFLNAKGIDPKRIKTLLNPLKNDVGLNQSLRQQYDLMGGEEAFGQSFDEYRENTFNDLLNSAIAAKAGYNYNIDRMTFENAVEKENELALNSLGWIGDNLTLEEVSSTAFEGTPSVENNEKRIDNLISSIDNLGKDIANNNYKGDLLERKTNQLTSLRRQLEMAQKVKENLYEGFSDAEVQQMENSRITLGKYLKDSNTTVPLEDLFLSQDKLLEKYNVKDDNASRQVFLNTIGDIKSSLRNSLPTEYDIYNNWNSKVNAKLSDKYSSISRPVYSKTGGVMPGMSATESKTFWAETEDYASNIGNWMDARLVIKGQLGESQTLQSYLTANDIEYGSKEYEAINKEIEKAAKSLKIGQHPTLSDEGIWNISVALPGEDGKVTAVDLALSTENIKTEATEMLKKSPLWKFESLASTAAASGLDSFKEIGLEQYGDWTWHFNENIGIDKVSIDGEDYSFEEAAAIYDYLLTKDYDFDIPKLVREKGGAKKAEEWLKKELNKLNYE